MSLSSSLTSALPPSLADMISKANQPAGSSTPRVAPAGGYGATGPVTPQVPSQQTSFGPVKTANKASVGDQDINISQTNFPDLTMGIIVVALVLLALGVLWWVL